ncbi:hypothetical protein LTS18_000048 [Coniosporium uncinatum]|uniref:Uncharacterized protein n=1 Tax=Coniosporium uncinatum TaxID=93489 RepID=A0ACC3DDA4_9PEZI|nr:hypothetical protein LTS18_000048 [Coniosporium uncinatum]
MFLRPLRPFWQRSLRSLPLQRPHHPQRRTLIPAPTSQTGPLMSRRSDRALPSPPTSIWQSKFVRTLPLFLVILVGSTAAIFNYQKCNSSVVNSTLYALRTNAVARRELGDEVYFGSKVPWVWGTLNQLHGHIDIRFTVKGTLSHGEMRFRAERRSRMGFFETLEWSLKMPDGRVIPLLQADAPDPFARSELNSGAELSSYESA